MDRLVATIYQCVMILTASCLVIVSSLLASIWNGVTPIGDYGGITVNGSTAVGKTRSVTDLKRVDLPPRETSSSVSKESRTKKAVICLDTFMVLRVTSHALHDTK